MTASLLLSQLQQAKNSLEDAQIDLCGAVTAHAEAKRALELAEALRLREGVEGKNEAQRDARLRLELCAEYTALAEAEDTLTEARCAYEVARLEWELARYKIRTMDVYSMEVAA
ncbi:hypothetical protein [Coleofasciculus sp. H7-2]|uniref:hypothetical protein n=1 Tax=Coleofasciculus sp. H7-2 TaxID=3351545 RepID=UPI00366F54FF